MTIIFKQKIELEQFLEDCERTLFCEERKSEIVYNTKWEVLEIKKANKDLFDDMG